MKYRKRPVTVEATQWFKNGDHPLDGVGEMAIDSITRQEYPRIEGALVRFFRRPEPECAGHRTHSSCGHTWHDHGWIDTLEGEHTVCPGDFIITGVQGEHYPCKPDIFAATYELEGAKEFGDQLRDVAEVQGRDGNWNYSSYMCGLNNGLELALALYEDREPVFKHLNKAGTTGTTGAELYCREETLFKVRDALIRAGLTPQQIIDTIADMQNNGIYFREARQDDDAGLSE